jgi:4-oxalmesaconate hydratase
MPLVIDAHTHLIAPDALYAFRSTLLVSRGLHIKSKPDIPDEQLAKSAAHGIALMDAVGTDMQVISPRPFQLMHSHQRAKDVEIWISANNDLVARTVAMHPTRFSGVGALPQVGGQPVEIVFDEIDRCIDELGLVGVLVNPDPGEGNEQTPTLGDEYWYPLWEKLVKKNIPAHIHGTACYGRENYSEHYISEESLAITSIARSKVFADFPQLKLMISHGGGSIPYQIGRWRAERLGLQATWGGAPPVAAHKEAHNNQPGTVVDAFDPDEPFEKTLRRFWFDTVLYDRDTLELLFKKVGADRCIFGTERPGGGSAIDPASGRPLDDLKPVIESLETLSESEKAGIFEGNVRSFYSRLNDSLANRAD